MRKKIINKVFFYVNRVCAKYDKKKKFFSYNIDKAFFDVQEKTLTVEGWGFCQSDFSHLDFQVAKNIGKKYVVERCNREDVNDVYNIPKIEKLGFKIKIIEPVRKNILQLYFKNSVGTCLAVKINLKKLGKLSTKSFFKNAVEVIKSDGVFEGVHRIQYQKNNIWNEYDFWIYRNENYDINAIKSEIKQFDNKPKISIVVPVYNVAEEWLRKNIESVQEQFYENWELCLADDHSPLPHIKKILLEYAEKDNRIKVVFREKNGHISEATNSAIDIATGNYIGFMDNDDELSPAALYEYVKVLNEEPNTEFIYCDEDMIDKTGRRFNPFFKSNWNSTLLLGHNYITHFVLVKRELLDKVGKLRNEVNGSQDYDFVLRATEATDKIYHVPKILYHWRTIEGSVAENPEAKNYAYVAGQKSLEDALKRRKVKGTVSIGKEYGTYKIDYQYLEETLVSIVVVHQSEDQAIEEECLNQLILNTEYNGYEIIAVNFNEDNIKDPEKKVHFIYNNANRTFNQLRNYAVKKAKGEFLVFLNSTVLPKNNLWLKELANEGKKTTAGLVGCKVLNCDNLILNAGMWFDDKFKRIHYTHQGCTSDNIGYYYRLTLPQNVFAVGDECVFVEKALFQTIGGWSEKFGASLSAIDLSLKVQKLGKNVIWTPYTVVKQIESRTISLEKEDFESFFSDWMLEDCVDGYTNPYIIEKKI